MPFHMIDCHLAYHPLRDHSVENFGSWNSWTDSPPVPLTDAYEGNTFILTSQPSVSPFSYPTSTSPTEQPLPLPHLPTPPLIGSIALVDTPLSQYEEQDEDDEQTAISAILNEEEDFADVHTESEPSALLSLLFSSYFH